MQLLRLVVDMGHLQYRHQNNDTVYVFLQRIHLIGYGNRKNPDVYRPKAIRIPYKLIDNDL